MLRQQCSLLLLFALVAHTASMVYEQPAPILPIDDPWPDIADEDSYDFGKAVRMSKRQVGYDYGDALKASVQFYEAQLSGNIPENDRVYWRKPDSAQSDSGNFGEDLSGGMYDAGDHVKFNLPMAWTTTMLAWGYIEFEAAYNDTGEANTIREILKWNCDYFIKCHPNPDLYYHQVGDPGIDHSVWDRPENISMLRPAYAIGEGETGSDVAGETAAALAGCAKVFADYDPTYSAQCLATAQSLYSFAESHLGTYPQQTFYVSTNYWDEMAWAAIWIYWASGNVWYQAEAETLFATKSLSVKSYAAGWNDKREPLKLLLSVLSTNDELSKSYRGYFKTYINGWLPEASVPYTPLGLVCRDQWGSLRWAANTAALAILGAHYDVRAAAYTTFALTQLDYILGSSGHSYVVGVGENPPVEPHHRASSCPNITEECTNTNSFNYEGPNHHVLRGAMVGGPDCNDVWFDNRADYVRNEVACDYNAGFQTLVAGVHSMVLGGIIV
ncbi:endoglucanase Z-like [Saccoglossus kowalevskii]|uniref:Endoglucanase n=1 Tax=Saccoglossus kowalevskii TaxID=10224 RepID=A0ABM0LXC2_SACKO|nr:PREDICTED: endoglucanase-like [Saccoglossus kowalevskii]